MKEEKNKALNVPKTNAESVIEVEQKIELEMA
jgi:hypothetical protein